MAGSVTTKNHYVPQSYLRVFESDRAGKSLGVYDKDSGRLHYSTASGQGFEKLLYWNNIEHSDKNFYETQLGKVETRCGDFFKNIKSMWVNQLNSISQEDIYSLSVLVAFQLFRTPSVLSEIERGFKDSLRNARELVESQNNEHKEVILKMLELQDAKDNALQTMIVESKRLALSMIENFRYALIRTEKEPLIICDRPVIQLEEGGLIDSSTFYPKSTDLLMPLSRNLVLVLSRKDTVGFLDISSPTINELTVRNAEKRIYFHPYDEEYAVSKIERTTLDFQDIEPFIPSKFHIMEGGVSVTAVDSSNNEEVIFESLSYTNPGFWDKTSKKIIYDKEIVRLYEKYNDLEITVDQVLIFLNLPENRRSEVFAKVSSVINDSFSN